MQIATFVHPYMLHVQEIVLGVLRKLYTNMKDDFAKTKQFLNYKIHFVQEMATTTATSQSIIYTEEWFLFVGHAY